MKPAVYISWGALAPHSLESVLQICADNGIDGVELGATCGLLVDDIKSYSPDTNVESKLLIHNYFPKPKRPFVLNLAAESDEIRELSVSHCLGAIDLCANLHVPFYSLHSGFALEAAPQQLGGGLLTAPRIPRHIAYKNFTNNLKSVCNYAEKRGIRLLIENNVVTRSNLVDGRNELLLGADSFELKRILSDVKSPVLGILADLGHLKVTAQTLGFDKDIFIDSLADNIEAFHLSDNDGMTDTHSEFDSSAWFFKHLSRFRTAVFVLEIGKSNILKMSEMARLVRKTFSGELQ